MKKPNVFMVVGKSFSGKDTLVNVILRDKGFCKENNIERLVRYTTRAKRPGETEGKEYHFISDKRYQDRYVNNPEAIVTSFKSEFGYLHYITDFSKLDPDKNYIVTGDQDMIKPFKEKLGKDNLCVIYLITPNWLLMKRWHNREDNEGYSDKKWQEICRRYHDEMVTHNAHANEFLANTNSIINLSSDFLLNDIKSNMVSFILGDKKSIILSNNGDQVYDNNYFPRYNYTYDIMNGLYGKISICNGKIEILSESSTFAVYMDGKVITNNIL